MRKVVTVDREFLNEVFSVSLSVEERSGLFTDYSPAAKEKFDRTIKRTMHECAREIEHLELVNAKAVKGSERPAFKDLKEAPEIYDEKQLVIGGQQVMQDWEHPLMEDLARSIGLQRLWHPFSGMTRVLEVGFGMGISAGYIQECRVRQHTIIDANPTVIKAALAWRETQPGKQGIELIEGLWQDAIDKVADDHYDGVLFDVYPQNEAEYYQATVLDTSWVQAFIPHAAKKLVKGGFFTFFTDEIDSISRDLQRLLLRHFSTIEVSLHEGLRPPEDCNYWFWDTMAVVKAVK